MCETKRMPNLVEANCESCAHCGRVYYKDFMQVFLLTPNVDKLALGRCTRRTPNLLVTLVSSCKEWANAKV